MSAATASGPGQTPSVRRGPRHRTGRHQPARSHSLRHRRWGRTFALIGVLVLLGGLGVFLPRRFGLGPWAPPSADAKSLTQAQLSALPLGQRIVAIARSQLGYSSDPQNTYCNKYSAYWGSGSDCGNGNYSEEWCADFAAWVWQKAGALVDYQYINGDLNASSASFYEWGIDHGTWHPVGSGYVPQPGDVAVYGLDAPALIAEHVAIVTGYQTGDRGPDVINGDGDRTGFSVVEAIDDQYSADTHLTHYAQASISGYVSPTPTGS